MKIKHKLPVFCKKNKNRSVSKQKLFLDLLDGTNKDDNERASKLLHLSCINDREDVLLSLLQNHPDINLNARSEYGLPALFHCIENTSFDCFILLLNSGVDLCVTDQDGNSALVFSIALNNFTFADKLVDKLPWQLIKDAISFCVATSNSEAIAILLDNKKVNASEFSGQLNFLDETRFSAVHYASKRGFLHAVESLVDAGCKASARNISPIKLAWEHKHYTIYTLLLCAGYLPSTTMKPSLPNEWVVITTDQQCHQGYKLNELLTCLKRFSNEQTQINIICRNIHARLDLLDFFLGNHVERLIFVNCYMEYIPLARDIKGLCLYSCVADSFQNLAFATKLNMLSLVDCKLCNLPIEIKELKQLKYLKLNRNKNLKSLPLWLTECKIEFLSVTGCQLSELPDLLPSTIKYMDANNNKIKRVSPFISQLDSLMHISLIGNPLLFPPSSMTQRSTKELKKYLLAFLEDNSPNDSVKVSLVGKEKSGKSSLVKALSFPTGICGHQTIPKTDGLEISQLKVNGIKLRMFDLAGDIEFLETHSMFLSKDALILAVFDLRTYSLSSSKTDFLSRIEVWLSSIFTEVPNAPVILVGTHSDAHMITSTMLEHVWQNINEILLQAKEKHLEYFSPQTPNRCLLCTEKTLSRISTNGVAGYVVVDDAALPFDSHVHSSNTRYAFPHIIGYYEVSNICCIPRKFRNKQNLSMEQLKNAIHASCKDILSVFPSVPLKWLALHDVLLKQVEKHYPILSYQHLAEIASTCGFSSDGDELTPFLEHFHSNGELLHYSEIVELCDVIIIDPQWLSNQLRTVISYRYLPYIHDGVIEHKHLREIWSHLDEQHQVKLIYLFRQAGVFLPFTEKSELIPCRLPIGRPSDDMWYPVPLSGENQLDFVMEFDVLPPTLFSHLISRIESLHLCDFRSKMKPLYLSNHAVYITTSDGIPCDAHTKIDSNCKEDVVALPRFLSFEPESEDNLLDMSENFKFCEIKVQKRRRHRIHFEIRPHRKSIYVSIRGTEPCCLAPETIDLVNRVRITRYENLNSTPYIACPICVRKKYNNPCRFRVSDINNLEPVCDKGHDCNSWRSILTGKCDFVQPITTEHIVTCLTDTQSPRLFALMPLNMDSVDLKDFYTFSYLKEGYSVHLMCEYPDCWHFLQASGYPLSRPKDFVKKYGHRLKKLLRVLGSLETPLRLAMYEPVTSLAESFTAMKKLSHTLEGYLNDFKEEFSCFDKPFISIADDIQYLMSNDGLHRRDFRNFLNKADEEKRFGDLLPVFQGNDVMWLCEEHYVMSQVRHRVK